VNKDQPEMFLPVNSLGNYREQVINLVGNDGVVRRCVQMTPIEVGMAISTRVGNFKWTGEQQRQVDAAIMKVARTKGMFTADDIWHELGAAFPVTKGLAGRLNAAVRQNIIRNTGTVSHAKRGGLHDHAQRLTVWAAYGI
jgi:hypothetical protein